MLRPIVQQEPSRSFSSPDVTSLPSLIGFSQNGHQLRNRRIHENLVANQHTRNGFGANTTIEKFARLVVFPNIAGFDFKVVTLDS
ncbi:unannotated protein [freshwater metagenome]|uniref:Unannotated protein n=1 Tax=freshwater metagenome TaxID=449393 RepID=A0A6J6BU34_9ZZZZ